MTATQPRPTKTYDLDRITDTVVSIIQRDHILTVYKVKQGGTRHVTVGPYYTATEPKWYAFFATSPRNPEVYSIADARHVARTFIDYVGRDKARAAVREWAADQPNIRVRQS